MGVSEIWQLLKPSGRTRSLYQIALEGVGTGESSNSIERVSVIGIDMGTYFGECVAAAQSSGMNVGSAGGPFRPLFFRLCKLLKIPAAFVFVLDGPERPLVKRNTHVQANKPLWWVETAAALIDAFGFCVHQAPGEAEAELAMLNRWGLIDAIMTADGDAIVFGAKRVLRTLSSGERGGTDNVQEYVSSDITNSQGFTTSGLVLYALTAGGDYDSGLAGCGRVYASELALSGIGDTLYTQIKAARSDIEKEVYLQDWRQRTLQAISADNLQFSTRLRNSLHDELSTGRFPPLDVINNYICPATSATFSEYLNNSLNWREVQQPNPPAIIEFCRNRLDWSNSEALLKVLRGNLWEGLVLRLMYSELCIWTKNTNDATFGTSAHELKIQSCELKRRTSKTVAGQIQGRVQVREAEVVEVLVGKDQFPEVSLAADTVVEVWALAAVIPSWASTKFGNWVKHGGRREEQSITAGKGKGKAPLQKEIQDGGARARKGKGNMPLKAIRKDGGKQKTNSQPAPSMIRPVAPVVQNTMFIEPTGRIFQDIQKLEKARLQEVIEVSSGDEELEGNISPDEHLVLGKRPLEAGDRGEGPSKKRRFPTDEVIEVESDDETAGNIITVNEGEAWDIGRLGEVQRGVKEKGNHGGRVA